MQTRKRNFLTGSVAALVVASGLALGGRITWPEAHASAQPQTIVTTAAVTADQQSLAAVMTRKPRPAVAASSRAAAGFGGSVMAMPCVES